MKIINSKENQIITFCTKLKNKKDREINHLFLVEGLHLVDEAYKAKKLKMVFSINEDILEKYEDVDTYLINEKILNKLTDTINPSGIIGVAEMGKNEIESSKIIMLDDVSDPGNLGTIIRTAAALGYNKIISSYDTVDYYNEKVVRATQGTIFKVQLIKASLYSEIKKLQNDGYKIYATSLSNAANVKDVIKNDKVVLIFGNEAHGIRNEILELADEKIKIKMENDVESLNVAVASSIIMWEFK